MYRVLKTAYTGEINSNDSGRRNLKILGYVLENMSTGVTCIVDEQEAYDIAQEFGIVNAEGRTRKLLPFPKVTVDRELVEERRVVSKGYIVGKDDPASLKSDEFLLKLDKSVVETYNTSDEFKKQLVDEHGNSRI